MQFLSQRGPRSFDQEIDDDICIDEYHD
jgi:hypothetical protein